MKAPEPVSTATKANMPFSRRSALPPHTLSAQASTSVSLSVANRAPRASSSARSSRWL